MTDTIMAIHIDKRSKAAPLVQEILTKYGELIQFRLGLHDLHHGDNREHGRILLQALGDEERVQALQKALSALDLVKVKTIELD